MEVNSMSIQTEFINKIAPLIQKYAPQYSIKVCSPIIAQAFIESRYGESGLAKQAHNYFGLKCGSKWDGKYVVKKTNEEYTTGTLTEISAAFRAYDSMEEGVKGYFEFINKQRYQNLKGITDPRMYCETIKADGYATSSTYVTTLMNCINTYNLTIWDKAVNNTPAVSVIDSSKVIQIALAEEGYLEKKSNAYLDDKTANAGDKNYTKYWRDVYPSFQGQYWCDCFVKWAFIKAYGIETAKKLLCHDNKEWSFYTPTSAQYFKNHNQWFTSNPKQGDVIFFKNSTRICHTGIVTKVSGNTVYTIEGNTTSAAGVVANGGCVRQKSYQLGSSYIAGFGRPNYTASSAVNVPSSNQQSSSKSYNKTVQWIGIVNATQLNIRKGPGTQYDRLQSYPTLNKGFEVGVCDSAKSSDGKIWYYIKISGSNGEKYGFASAEYIIKKGTSNTSTGYSSGSNNTSADKMDKSLAGTYIVTASTLNMRNKAGNGSIIAKLPNGTRVQNYGYYTVVDGVKWLYIVYNNQTGFCSSTYLKKS